jgi:pyruvate kinase
LSEDHYTNKMRYAIRTVKNPTRIPVDVLQHTDGIELRVSSTQDFKRLAIKDRMNFISYLHTMADYISSEGARVYVTGAEV